MTTWVALLRAVNVGGRNAVRMADLRRVVGALPAHDVRTYVQSGNVVFASSTRTEAKVVDALTASLIETFGFEIGVVVRSAAALDAAVAANPLAAGRDPARLAVTFLSAPPAAGTVGDGIQTIDGEEFALVGREIYLHAPNGLGRSKLTPVLSERRLGVRATTRNWRTTTTLAAMAATPATATATAATTD